MVRLVRDTAVAAAVVTVTAGLFVASRWQAPTPAESNERHGQTNTVSPAIPAVEVDAAANPREADSAEQHPLQTYLLTVAAESRDSVLLSMIRDAGFPCTESVSIIQLLDEAAAWRISCAGAQLYGLAVDSFGELRIEPLAYGEGPFRPAVEPIER
jgi:hypothetical protein